MADRNKEVTSKLIKLDTFSTGIELDVFQLSVEGAHLKVEFYEDASNNFDTHSVRVRDIRIPEEERGKGLGQILQNELLRECKKRGIVHIYGSSPNPYALLSWLKIPEARKGFHLLQAGRRIHLDGDFLEAFLRKEIETRKIENIDIQPPGSKFFEYVIDVNSDDEL